ncbi:MAG: MogA/MoaB family molybdenum cofactor biosynthesis protein [Desulfobulbaceae bacterium]|nr:MogA/MoaB family molybdenum cofactor biosynthesis protein [Desulfobulbaceae bacterium]
MTEPTTAHGYTCGILTVSDKGSRGQRQDTSGPRLREMLTANGFTVTNHEIVPDSQEAIANVLSRWVDEEGIDLIVTTGGTGVSPSDLTPEATRPLLDREIPGIGEAMRRASLEKTPHAMLSRGIAGIRKSSLIINLPGSEKGARENIEVVLPMLSHALYKIKGGMKDCGS